MQDKQRLQQEASRLQMENEQLQELVGFLTVQLEGSLPDTEGEALEAEHYEEEDQEEEGMLVFTPEELQHAVRHKQRQRQQEQQHQQHQQQEAALVTAQGSPEVLPAVSSPSIAVA
jgi:hypothetical protein